jgi:DNA-binding winged helix-turn-helix (wHTH) protein/tetratricopeptide (TPR) repeat protein
MTVRGQVVYEFGPVRIDSSNRTLTLNGQGVPMQPRGFDALLLFLERRNQVVSKSELLTKFWPDTHVEESSLPVMVSAIRRAIGDDGRNQKYLQTVSKVGYRFVGDVAEICVGVPAYVSELRPDFEDDVSPVAPSEETVAAPLAQIRSRRFFTLLACVAAAAAALFLIYRQTTMHKGQAAATSVSARTDAEVWSQKGRYAWNLQTKDGFLRSIEYYQKAIIADPEYAPAYAGLAKSYVTLPSYSQRPDDQQWDRARAATAKALNLNDRLADAHIARGMVFLILDHNFAGSSREFLRAIALDPQSSLAEGELALCLVAVGQAEQAVAHARQAKVLDPLSVRAATDLGIVLLYSHRFTESESELEDVLKLDPYSYRANLNLGKTYLSLGRFKDALRVLQEAALLSKHDPAADGLTAAAEALGGNMEGAESIVAALLLRSRTTYVAPISLAHAFAGMGRVDDALIYLRKARNVRAIGTLFLKVDPSWAPLHGNREFRDLVSDITLATGQ